jgi:DNA-binding transcriptional MerR regulator
MYTDERKKILNHLSSNGTNIAEIGSLIRGYSRDIIFVRLPTCT